QDDRTVVDLDDWVAGRLLDAFSGQGGAGPPLADVANQPFAFGHGVVVQEAVPVSEGRFAARPVGRAHAPEGGGRWWEAWELVPVGVWGQLGRVRRADHGVRDRRVRYHVADQLAAVLRDEWAETSQFGRIIEVVGDVVDVGVPGRRKLVTDAVQ